MLGNHCLGKDQLGVVLRQTERGKLGVCSVGQEHVQQQGWSQSWERQSRSVCREGREQRDPEDTRAGFVDKSCGKSRLTDGSGGGGALEGVRCKRQLRVRGGGVQGWSVE